MGILEGHLKNWKDILLEGQIGRTNWKDKNWKDKNWKDKLEGHLKNLDFILNQNSNNWSLVKPISSLFLHLAKQRSLQNIAHIFLNNGPTPASFSFTFILSNTHYIFYNKLMWKYVHPVYGAGIRTHDTDLFVLC